MHAEGIISLDRHAALFSAFVAACGAETDDDEGSVLAAMPEAGCSSSGCRVCERRTLRRSRAMPRPADSRAPLLLLEQEPLAPAGHITDWLARRGIDHRAMTAATGEPLPDFTCFGGIIALGSQRSAYDDHVPWVRR